MSAQQVAFSVRTKCPKCVAIGNAQLRRNFRGGAISLEWECRWCEHRWPVTFDEIKRPRVSQAVNREEELLREIASLRKLIEHLRASSLRWRELYENAIRRVAERDEELPKTPNR